jgi:hypothetical protein
VIVGVELRTFCEGANNRSDFIFDKGDRKPPLKVSITRHEQAPQRSKTTEENKMS